VAVVVYTRDAIADLARLGEFLREDPAAAAATTGVISTALKILADHPLVGRTTDPPLRELVISRGETGYIALYEYNPFEDRVLVHDIRHQREAGFEE